MDQKKMLNDTLEQQRTPTHWRQTSSAKFTGPLLCGGVADLFCWQINRAVRGQRRECRPSHANAAQSSWQARVKSVTYQELLLDCTLIRFASILSCENKLDYVCNSFTLTKIKTIWYRFLLHPTWITRALHLRWANQIKSCNLLSDSHVEKLKFGLIDEAHKCVATVVMVNNASNIKTLYDARMRYILLPLQGCRNQRAGHYLHPAPIFRPTKILAL